MPTFYNHSVLEFPSTQPLLVEGCISFKAVVEAIALARRVIESAWSLGSRVKITGIQFTERSLHLHLLERRSSDQLTLPGIETAEGATKKMLERLMAHRIGELNDESRSAGDRVAMTDCELPGGAKASNEQVECLDRLLKRCARHSIFAAPEACGNEMPVTSAFRGRTKPPPSVRRHEIVGRQTGTLNAFPIVEERYVLEVDTTTMTPEGLLIWAGLACSKDLRLLQLTQCAQREFDLPTSLP